MTYPHQDGCGGEGRGFQGGGRFQRRGGVPPADTRWGTTRRVSGPSASRPPGPGGCEAPAAPIEICLTRDNSCGGVVGHSIRGASIGQVWTRHLAPAAPASRPSLPTQFHDCSCHADSVLQFFPSLLPEWGSMGIDQGGGGAWCSKTPSSSNRSASNTCSNSSSTHQDDHVLLKLPGQRIEFGRGYTPNLGVRTWNPSCRSHVL